MSTGALQFDLSDLQGNPIQGKLRVRFAPEGNTGGTAMEASFDDPGVTFVTVSNLPCRPGPGTLYRVSVESRNYRTYSFFQMIHEGKTAKASDNQIRMAARPWRVKGILAPPVAPALAAILPSPGFFDAQPALHQACLLNVFAKARHNSASNVFRFAGKLLRLEQDRVFCEMAVEAEAFLTSSERFKSAPSTLHDPLPGFELRTSFKSRDARANLQVTLMREAATGRMAADIDIDEATGIEHGFEVLRNYVTGGKTNPYQIHELLLLSELDPGYALWFG